MAAVRSLVVEEGEVPRREWIRDFIHYHSVLA